MPRRQPLFENTASGELNHEARQLLKRWDRYGVGETTFVTEWIEPIWLNTDSEGLVNLTADITDFSDGVRTIVSLERTAAGFLVRPTIGPLEIDDGGPPDDQMVQFQINHPYLLDYPTLNKVRNMFDGVDEVIEETDPSGAQRRSLTSQIAAHLTVAVATVNMQYQGSISPFY